MPHDTLEKFSQQIADWAEELLEHGRYPFRKVALTPLVLTPSGEVRPDLVFWINRPSCMAGGVLFFPRNATDTLLQDYAEAAQSLGLSFFTVWSTQAIEIRHATAPYELKQRLTIADTSSPQEFRKVLVSLLDSLKPLAVTGAIPPADLSAWHLVNLCLLTVESAQPAMLEAMRRHRQELAQPSPEDRSTNRCWHTLFHLLMLSCHDLLPETVHAERLDRALEIATESLPKHLKESCQCLDPAPLPDAAAVAFHHLFRRLTQIGWHKDKPRMQTTLEQLLTLSGHDLSTPVDLPQASHPLLCNPRHFVHPAPCSLLSTPGRFPGLVLHRDLKGLPPATYAVTSPLRLPYSSNAVFDAITGQLLPQQFAPGLSAEEPLMHLRVSWPNRRFRPPRQTPAWMLGFLHLIGLARDHATLTLETPGDWPRSSSGHFLLSMILEDITLTRLEHNQNSLGLTLCKVSPEDSSLVIQRGKHLRQVESHWLTDNPATALALAIYLPDEVWELIQRGDLGYQKPGSLPVSVQPGINRFLASSWGKLLLSSSGIPAPKPSDSGAASKSTEWLPLPPTALLQLLCAKDLAPLSDVQIEDRVERELSQWFATKPPQASADKARSGRAKRLLQSDKQQLLETVFVDGIPRFPEQYLFNHYRPELLSYSLPGTLRFQRRFFNQVELTTPDDQLVIADSDRLAHALLLVSHGGLSEVQLPQDEAVLDDIIQRYISDLEELRNRLLDQCNRHFESAEQARSLAKTLWGQKELPPWETLTWDF